LAGPSGPSFAGSLGVLARGLPQPDTAGRARDDSIPWACVFEPLCAPRVAPSRPRSATLKGLAHLALTASLAAMSRANKMGSWAPGQDAGSSSSGGPSASAGASGSSWAGAAAERAANAMRSGGAAADPFGNLERRLVQMPDGTWVANPPLLNLSPLQALETNPDGPPEVLVEFLERLEERNEILGGPQVSLNHERDWSNWAAVLASLGVDEQAAWSLARLAGRDKMGHAEATRLIAHLRKPGGGGFRDGPSRWLIRAVERSSEYLREWDRWEPQGRAAAARPVPRDAVLPGAGADRPWGAYVPPADAEDIVWEAAPRDPQAPQAAGAPQAAAAPPADGANLAQQQAPQAAAGAAAAGGFELAARQRDPCRAAGGRRPRAVA